MALFKPRYVPFNRTMTDQNNVPPYQAYFYFEAFQSVKDAGAAIIKDNTPCLVENDLIQFSQTKNSF